MFFAQTLAKKLYSNYGVKLNKIQDCFYPFNASKNNNKALLSYLILVYLLIKI